MTTESAGFCTMFRSLKDVVVDHVKTTWSPFERTEGKSLIQDVFSNTSNIQKLGMRVLHVGLAALFGLNTLSIVSAVVVSCPFTLNMLVGLTCATFVSGVAMTFFPDKIQLCVDAVAKQLQKVRDLFS